MKLSWFKKQNDKFQITEPDRLWVEDNFRWLNRVFGFPERGSEQILLSERYFPKTFKAEKVLVENIVADLCDLLQIPENKVSYEFIKDIRDTYAVPYQIEGKAFETGFESAEGKYKLYVANSLQSHPRKLIYCLVYDFIRIKLTDNKLKFDTGEDTGLFIYLAGIYFGFGVLLSQSLKDTGRAGDGFWETKWQYISDMPNEVMAFGLATYSKLIGQDAPKWKDNLNPDLKKQFEQAILFLEENPIELYNKKELEVNEFYQTANDLYTQNNFEAALSNYEKMLSLTEDDAIKAETYNNIGYCHLRLKNYEQSIPYFKNCIQIIPDYGFAHDNLAYALIQLGRLEEGKESLGKALESEDNDIAYTYRNLALYHQYSGDPDKAGDFFKKAFESTSVGVDLLEYHYADFLLQTGKADEGLAYLQKAVEKGEPEAVERMENLKHEM